MFLRGDTERLFRTLTEDNKRLGRMTADLAHDNMMLRGRVAEMERTLEREVAHAALHQYETEQAQGRENV